MKCFFIILFFPVSIFAQINSTVDSIFIRKAFDVALSEGKAYEDLRSLCKDIGARLTGSAEAEMAVYWGKQKLEEYGFDKVYLQEIKVPHWERGTKEVAWYKTKDGVLHKVDVLALGGSIGTNGVLTGEVILFNSLEEMQNTPVKKIEGKIVFLNQPMDEKLISTFSAYGGCWPVRGRVTAEAGKLGAKAVIIRSLGLPIDEHPHTGSMNYDGDNKKIPGAALSTKSAEELAWAIKNNKKIEFILEMDCKQLEEKISYNVIAEITGIINPENIITFGGHLDSWDVGEGAHDDGAGIVHSMEALRILKELNYKPNNTLRCVFFMNEENGNFGGKTYASWVKEKGENQIAGLESDAGGFSPRGFTCSGNDKQIKMLQSFAPLLKPYELHKFEIGYGGVDINPLKTYYKDIPLFGLRPDSQRYFDFHHTEADVFENVNKRELELGCGSMAALLYLLDRNL